MGFFKKFFERFKTASIKFIETPTEIPSSAKEISGKIILTALNDQKVHIINVRLEEIHNATYRVGEQEVKAEPDETITYIILDGFDIKKGETRIIPFTLVFKRALIAQTWVRKIKYKLIAVADLEGVALDPVATQNIQIEGIYDNSISSRRFF